MFRTAVKSVCTATALLMIGATGAFAATWAPSSNPIVMSGGGGYGTATVSGSNIVLASYLRDTKVGDGRVYARISGILWGNTNPTWSLSSGLRSDGESSYARMADQSGDPSGNTADYHYQGRTCRSVTLTDPCSDDIRNFNL